MAATTKRRINITLSPDVAQILKQLAERDDQPEATKAASIIRLAIEIEEDEVWDKLASKRDTNDAKFISHKKAWV